MTKSFLFRLLLLLLFAGSGSALAALPPPRPPTWAAEVAGTHVSNLYRVEPDLLRSAQPDSAGFQELASLGVKTILDLRAGHADAESAGKAALRLLNVPMRAWSARDDQVLRALRILIDPSNRPILVHCQKGADRTGMILALYRVVVQGWTKADALREMDDGGYHHSSWFRNLDRYVSNANVAQLRRELGISPPGLEIAAAAASRAGARPAAPHSPPIPDKLPLPVPGLIPLEIPAPAR